MIGFNLMIQETEMEKQILQQQIQILIDMIEYFKNTIVKSINEFMNKLKLNLNFFIGR